MDPKPRSWGSKGQGWVAESMHQQFWGRGRMLAGAGPLEQGDLKYRR